MAVYYNENDPFAAAWLRELIKENLIAPGDVDDRDIEDVAPEDIQDYSQCHFFAGIGGWSYALRLAGIPDDYPVWTGSCPCQPFSGAGKRKGADDKRHLWPEFRRLIAERVPAIVFGEQVANGLGRPWLAAVRADLEELGYAVGAADMCAAGSGAPHIRQRLFWVAVAGSGGLRRDAGAVSGAKTQSGGGRQQDGHISDVIISSQQFGRLANADQGQCRGLTELRGHVGDGHDRGRPQSDGQPRPCGEDVWLGDADDAGSQGRRIDAGQCADQRSAWASGVPIPCSDGKSRIAEPGIFPLAHGISNRVGKLRGSGNAIVPQVAATFIRSAFGAIAATQFQ